MPEKDYLTELKHALLFIKKLKHRDRDTEVIEKLLKEEISGIEYIRQF